MQAAIIQIKQDYRQLRYGRLSTLNVSDNEYQELLEQLKKNIRNLF